VGQPFVVIDFGAARQKAVSAKKARVQRQNEQTTPPPLPHWLAPEVKVPTQGPQVSVANNQQQGGFELRHNNTSFEQLRTCVFEQRSAKRERGKSHLDGMYQCLEEPCL